MSDIVKTLQEHAKQPPYLRDRSLLPLAADEILRLGVENEALREALKPFADMCADVESCAAEYPADHPASDPEEWFTGFEWGDLLRARALYERREMIKFREGY